MDRAEPAACRKNHWQNCCKNDRKGQGDHKKCKKNQKSVEISLQYAKEMLYNGSIKLIPYDSLKEREHCMPKAASVTENPKEKKSRKKTNWIILIAGMAAIIYVAVTIVGQNIRIYNAKAELSVLQDKMSLEIMKAEELKKVADAVENDDFDQFDDYVEKQARLNGFTKDGEVVYINIAGD